MKSLPFSRRSRAVNPWTTSKLFAFEQMGPISPTSAMVGGALGAALESDEAVRAAAYVQHSEDEADIGKAA